MKSCSLPCTRLVFPDRPSRNQFSVLSTGLVLVLMPVLSGYFLLSFSTMCWIVGLLETRNFSFCISDLSYWSILSELPENKLSIDYIDLCIHSKISLDQFLPWNPLNLHLWESSKPTLSQLYPYLRNTLACNCRCKYPIPKYFKT